LTDEKLLFDKSVGKEALDFTLESVGGGVTPFDYREKMVVLFFNEGSICYLACWNKIIEFANDGCFNNNDTEVFSTVIYPRYKWDKIINET